MDNYKLRNNIPIPKICYGTGITLPIAKTLKQKLGRIKMCFSIEKKNKLISSNSLCKVIEKSYNLGCRCYDTSSAYVGSEERLGKALKKYERSNVFVITKLSNRDQRTIGAEKALKNSLSKLNMSYVDLYLLHWPQTGTWIDNWKVMEKLYKQGLCKAIGVCNCNIHHIEELKKYANILPMVNQIELHPLFTQKELVDYCNFNQIQVMAYTSTARGDFRIKTSRRMEEICNKYNKTRTQVILRWHIQNGIIPIFNTYSEKHLVENLNIFDFSIDDNDMSIISGMNINARTRYDPDNCEFDRL